jgi:hypothetical protein
VKIIKDKDGKLWYDLGTHIAEVLPTDDCYYEYDKLNTEQNG